MTNKHNNEDRRRKEEHTTRLVTELDDIEVLTTDGTAVGAFNPGLQAVVM